MAERTIVCAFCGKSFQVADDVTKAFCVHCGAENQMGEKTIYDELDTIYDPSKRYSLLADYVDNHPEDEKAAMLAEIFELRYFTRGKNRYDGFLRMWFNMVSYSKRMDKAKELLNIQNETRDFFTDEKLMALRSRSEEMESLFWNEMKNAVELYFVSSKDDRQYTTSFLNLFKMKADAVTAKAAKEAAVAGVQLLEQCEPAADMARLTEISHDAFLKAFPGGAGAYNEALNQIRKEQAEAAASAKK